jgi:predicted DCC family thiol-disulfide oxidoreductase YuxK
VRRDGDSGPIVLYDGVCALCNGAVRFVLARDRDGMFRFASLQSKLARATLARHGRHPDDVSTIVVVVQPGQPDERLLTRSDAARFALSQLPGIWRVMGRAMAFVPADLRDGIYDLVARTRYRTFGKYDACPVPPRDARDRFLDL